MAELVATAALETLGELVVEESRFLAGVGARVEDVRRQLNRMHCFLKDANRRKDRLNSDSVQLWLRELQDMAIEAEQVLEIYGVEVMSRREGKDLMSLLKRIGCILGECVSMQQARKKAERIMSLLTDLTRRMNDSMAGGGSSSNVGEAGQVEWWRKTYGHEVEDHFVGMKDDLQHLTSLVTSDDKSSRVISICGMGGLGKTTLTRKIYQANKVQREFDAKAWICVSQQLRPTQIFQQMLKQLLQKERVEIDLCEDDLVRKLYNIQKQKKCLVVLDDVWEAQHWNILSRCFPMVESSSKVLITSRNENIVGSECVHRLQLLSEDEGWELLQKIALPVSHSQVGTSDLQRMKAIGKEIVRKCGRLPLAIFVIGGILRRETDWRDWEKVLHSVDSCLQRGEGIEKDRGIYQVLELSYDALPYNLKPCFLSLGCFEEDEQIDVEHLYLIWMAEGFISSDDKGREETLRDVAEHYLHELVTRCMVQATLDETWMCKRYSSCRLHDLVRELCLLKARTQGFLKVVDKDEGRDGSTYHRFHRLVIYNWDGGNKHIRRNSNLRGLLIRSWEVMKGNLGRFKYLKFLILEGLNFKDKKLPKGINKLVLLKYLRIYHCNLDTLSPAVCELPYLQSLHLEHKFGSWRIPNSIHTMRHLTYLCLGPGFRRTIVGGRKLKLRGLDKLETLVGFDSSVDDIADLIELKRLRIFKGVVCEKESLCIIVDHISCWQKQFSNVSLHVKCNIDSTEGLALLSKMLWCEPISELHLEGMRLRNLPAYSPAFGLNLMNLYLSGCTMVEDPMEALERLPVLRKLDLLHDAFVGTTMICKAGGFPQLKELYLDGLSNLVDWRVEETAMPHLYSLTIWACTQLEMIPDGAKFITSLTNLNVCYMPSEFNSRVREEGADYGKIKHVPSIEIIT